MLRAGATAIVLFTLGLSALSAQDEPREVTIAASGDILLHIKVVQAAEARGWGRVFGALRELLPADAIAFANLETPLVDDVRPVATGSPPILGAPSEAAAGLAASGVDVLGCANNHAFDQRATGLARTMAALEEAGLVGVGADPEPDAAFGHAVVERNGIRTAFLSYTERVNGGPGGRPPAAHVASLREEGRLEAALAAAREDADLVVLAVHWSHDFVTRPRRGQRRRAHRWVELGADFIVGTGPHVLQEVERVTSPRGDAVVAYSLGNLVSNQGKLYRPGRRASPRAHEALRIPETRDGVILLPRFALEGERIVLRALAGRPLFTGNNHWDRVRDRETDFDIWIQALGSADEAHQEARLPAIQAALGPAVELTL
ncbi:MAG: CapA family protein [Myxococcota bacterium]